MRVQLNFLILFTTICSVYSQKQNIIPVKPIRSYEIKIENLNGKYHYLYNDEENIALIGKCEISLYFYDNSKKDSLIIDTNGNERMTLRYDTEYSNYSRLNIDNIGTFNKGYKNGLWKTLYKNKLVKTMNYRNGLVIGRYRVYNTKGELLYKTTFGKYGNGRYKDYYYKTGVLKQQGNYKNGKKEGKWFNYDQNGHIKDSICYKKGMPIKN